MGKQLTAKLVLLAACEWCPDAAIYRVTARVAYSKMRSTSTSRQYRRFSCRRHVAKTDLLVRIDLGDRARQSVTNPTGFAEVSGRMLGAGARGRLHGWRR